jgi:hypothetical protein
MQRTAYPLRLPEELRQEVERMARVEERSINGQIIALVKAGLRVARPEMENAPVAGHN